MLTTSTRLGCALGLTLALGCRQDGVGADGDRAMTTEGDQSPSAGSTPGVGLVAAYGFEEGQGTATADLSGNGLAGVVSGASWTTGKFGSALRFSGNSVSWVTVADASALHLTTGMTVSAWVNPSSSTPSETAVIFKERPGDVTYSLYAKGPGTGPNANLTSSGVEHGVTVSSPITNNTWSYLAATFNGTTLSIYVNGTLASTTAMSGSIDSVNGVLRIGGDSVWSNEGFIGIIDEVRIYNRALSATEIQTDMATAISGTPPVDTVPPSGTIQINGGAASTNRTSVTLTLSATDQSGVAQMRLSNDGATFGAALPYATTAAWLLSTGDGAKTVYAQYQDTVGNWSGSIVARITLDTVAPTLTGVSAAAISANGSTISWTTNEGATSAVDYGTTAAHGQSVVNSSLASRHSVALSGLAAVTTYHYRVRSTDAAGNEVVGSDATFVTAATPTGGTVVSIQQILQTWGQSTWSPSTVQVTNVQAGDAIVVVGLYWVSSGPSVVPADNSGRLMAAVNQIPTYASPPVGAQIFYQLDVAPGTHIITPPNLAYGGDGALYVVLVRGLAGTFVGAGDSHAVGSALPGIATELSTGALPGDFVVAIGGEDDTVPYGPNAGMSGPPAGWQSVGIQNNADVNVPSAAYYRVVSSSGTQPVAWSWQDTAANVAAAAIAAFR